MQWQLDHLLQIDQVGRQLEDLFQVNHPCGMERELGRRLVLHQHDSQDPYRDES